MNNAGFEVNWLQQQEATRARVSDAIKRGDYQAAAIALEEFYWCENHHNGTAIYGENYFDIPQGTA